MKKGLAMAIIIIIIIIRRRRKIMSKNNRLPRQRLAGKSIDLESKTFIHNMHLAALLDHREN
jgi:hypothetical protein